MFIFKQQIPSKHEARKPNHTIGSSKRSSRSLDSLQDKIDPWLKWAGRQMKVVFIIYMIIILKYALIILLDLELFAAYRYMDCFVLGRFQFLGRTGLMSKYLAATLASSLCIYRIHLFGRPRHRFDCLNFLMKGHDAALKNQLQLDGPTSCKNNNTDLTSSDPTYFIRNNHPLVEHLGHSECHIQRLDRTPRCWQILARYTINYVLLIMVTAMVVTTSLFFLLSPSLFNSLGYCMRYSSCTRWLRTLNESQQVAYSYLIDPQQNVGCSVVKTRDLPIILPFNNFIPFNVFHVTRIVFDFMDDNIVYMDFFFTHACHLYIMLVMVSESYLNVSRMKPKLTSLIYTLNLVVNNWNIRENYMANLDMVTIRRRDKFPFRLNYHEVELQKDLIEIQKIISDHFRKTTSYNSYISFHCLFCVVIWLVYATVLCLWVGLSGRQAVLAELYFSMGLASVLFMAMFSLPASYRRVNLSLYTPISSLMALDYFNHTTKSTWITILDHFHPRPMYCFSILGSTELSWLFALKVSL